MYSSTKIIKFICHKIFTFQTVISEIKASQIKLDLVDINMFQTDNNIICCIINNRQ